jgi:hypothetical protein
VPAIYESNPDPAPDSDYVPGSLEYLVVGNAGRLLDQRRTPVTVTDVTIERGEFELAIEAFEDKGARWRLPLRDAADFQFDKDAPRAPKAAVAAMEDAVARFSAPLAIDADGTALRTTLARLDEERSAMAEAVRRVPMDALDVAGCVARREGDPRLYDALDEFLARRDLLDLDRSFAAALATNPRSGEVVKGHAIVLAELGLCPYRGTIVRDPGLFGGARSKARRAEHLIARLAFSGAMWTQLGHEATTLYRGAAAERALEDRVPASFLSATFSREVAEAHFEGGPLTKVAALWRQEVPVTRLLMTFLETRALNDRFKEAEAVLIGDAGNLAF